MPQSKRRLLLRQLKVLVAEEGCPVEYGRGDADPAAHLVHPGLKTPGAAAIAGILFSALLICSLWLFRQSVPISPHETGSWLTASSERVSLALNLTPFAGVAFLWFLGVLHDRLGVACYSFQRPL